MKHKNILISLILTLLTPTAFADPEVYVDVGNESYRLGLYTVRWETQYGNLAVNPDLILIDEGDYAITPGIHWQYVTNQSPYIHDIGIGMNFYFTRFDGYDVDAFAPGLWLRTQDLLDIPLRLASEIHFAPADLTWEEGENLWDWYAQLEYQLFPSIALYGGFRQITSKVENVGVRTIDETAYAGAKYIF